MSGLAAGETAIETAIRVAARPGRPAIVAYLTAGFPTAERFFELLPRVASAADALEIGVPFSDPVADGATIARANCLGHAGAWRDSSRPRERSGSRARPACPVLLMSYLNPLLAFGWDELAAAASDAGVSGLIVPDLPPEEAVPFRPALERYRMALVHLVTPVTPPARTRAICAESRGFVYAVTVEGTTGGDVAAGGALAAYLDGVRAVSPVPVIAGFGIRTAAQVAAIGTHADGVVIGSRLMEIVESGGDPAAFLESMRVP